MEMIPKVFLLVAGMPVKCPDSLKALWARLLLVYLLAKGGLLKGTRMECEKVADNYSLHRLVLGEVKGIKRVQKRQFRVCVLQCVCPYSSTENSREGQGAVITKISSLKLFLVVVCTCNQHYSVLTYIV